MKKNKKKNKQKNFNNKGFTLIELLVSVTILAIIMGIALPQMSNLQQQNKKTKYKKYAETMLSSAKLYTDSYAIDMFGHNTSGCVEKKVSELEAKGLIKDIKVSGDTCITDDTKVYIRKVNDYYLYETSIRCLDKKGNEVYKEEFKGVCNDGPDEEGPKIEITPNATAGWINSPPENIKIKVFDDSGMLENTKIKITLKKNGVVVASAEKEHNFKNKRYEGITSDPLEYNYELPATLSGIFSITVTPISVRDAMGIYTIDPVDSGEYKVDTESPTCEVTGGNTTWINSSSSTTSRVIKAECHDTGGSGCVTAEFSHTYEDNINTTKAGAKGNNSGGSVRDAAGNVTNCSADQTVKIDKTPPTCGTITIDGTEGNNDWYKSNVTIGKTNGRDATSGHASTTVSHSSISSDTTGTTVTLTTRDNAGNTCTRTETIKVDKTPPPVPTVNMYKWNNNSTAPTSSSGLSSYSNNTWSNRKVHTNASGSTDTISGLKEYQYTTTGATTDNTNKAATYRNVEANGTSYIKWRACDNAGNCSSYTTQKTIKIDKTEPTCTDRGDSTTWTKNNRTIYYECDDGTGSGCDPNHAGGSTPFSSTTKTATIAAYTIKDNAGNTTNCPARTANVYVDKTAPSAPTINLSSAGETSGDVTFTLSSVTESQQSGVKKRQYKIGGGNWTDYNGGSITLLTNTGAKTVYAKTIDNVGNESASSSATGKCDKDQVTVERVSNRAANGKCYFTLKFTNNNTLSGASGYDYIYWNPKQTTDTSNLGNGYECTTVNANLNAPSSLNLHKSSGTITGNTIEIRQYYSKQYYCLAVRPHRSTEISALNRWTVQHKHAITGSTCS